MSFSKHSKKFHRLNRLGLSLVLCLLMAIPSFAADTTVVPKSSSINIPHLSYMQANGVWNISGSNNTALNWGDLFEYSISGLTSSLAQLSQLEHKDLSTISDQIADIVTSGIDLKYWLSTDDHLGMLPAGDSDAWTSTASYNLNRVTAWYFMMNDGSQYAQVQDGLSIYQQLKFLFVTTNTSLARGLVRLAYHNPDDMYLYSMDDMSQIELPDDYQTGSLWDTSLRGFSNLSYGLSKLVNVFANPDDLALKEAVSDNVQAVTSDLTGDNDISVTPTSISGVKGIGSDIKDELSSSASASDGLSVIKSDSDAWSWFSSENASAFDSTSRSMLRGAVQTQSDRRNAPYLEQYNTEVSTYVD